MRLSVTLLGFLYGCKKCSTIRIITKDRVSNSLRVFVCVFVFLLGDLRDRDQTLCGTVQDSGCKGVWQVVWCGVRGKQVYGVMGDGRQIHALISQLEYIYLFFSFSKQLACTLKINICLKDSWYQLSQVS